MQIKTTPDMMSELVDWFGTEIKLLENKNGYIVVKVNCNQSAMRYWALQYGPYVEIISPESLRGQLEKDIRDMAEKYNC